MTNHIHWRQWAVYGNLIRATRFIETISSNEVLTSKEVQRIESARRDLMAVAEDIAKRLREK